MAAYMYLYKLVAAEFKGHSVIISIRIIISTINCDLIIALEI